jgi:hypothetical protein
VIIGSIGFFLGPIVLAIAAAALFDDGALVQVVAAGGALVVGMAAAWLVGRAFGFSKESPP